MGLKLTKNREGQYRRMWYATLWIDDKLTSRSLDIPVRGAIPLDANGRFSLQIVGHTTTKMTLRYYKPRLKNFADSIRNKLRAAAAPQSPDLAAAIQSILTSTDLTPEAKNAAILALSSKPMLPDN